MKRISLTAAVLLALGMLTACAGNQAVEARPAAAYTPLADYPTYETVYVTSIDEVPENCHSLLVSGWDYIEGADFTDEELQYSSTQMLDYWDFPRLDVFEYVVTVPEEEGPALLDAAVQRDLTMLGVKNIDMTDLDGFSQMPHLEVLWLSSSNFAPKYSGSFSSLTDLQVNFSDLNRLGSIPKITTLQKLALRHTAVTSLKGIDKLTNLSKLDLTGTHIRTLAPLRTMTQLTALNLSYLNSYNKRILPDLQYLAGMQNLKTLGLNMNNNGLRHVETLAELQALEQISAVDCRVESAEPFAALPELRSLNLTANKISDLEPLGGLAKLESLNLYNNEITDLSPIAGLTQLKTLHVGANDLIDISAVENMNELEVFSAGRCPNLSKISALRHKSNLKELDLSGTNAVDPEVLSTNTQLEVLDLSGTKLQATEFLGNFPQLRVLNLEQTKIADITPILQLSKLEELNINGTKIADIDGISVLSNLRRLNISSTPITSIKSLYQLPSLYWVKFNNCSGVETYKKDEFQEWFEAQGEEYVVSEY